MAKKSGMMQLVDKLVAQEEARIRQHARIFMMDMVTVTLGRMGWGEKRFIDFDKKLAEVCDEYAIEIIEDSKDDKDIDYAKSRLDRELAQYVGKLFVPYDERYDRGLFR